MYLDYTKDTWSLILLQKEETPIANLPTPVQHLKHAQSIFSLGFTLFSCTRQGMAQLY